MSHDERQLPVTTNAESNSSHRTLISPRYQQASTLLDHKQSYSTLRQDASAANLESQQESQLKQYISTMAMQNLGPNSLQQERQLKHTSPNSVNDTPWNNSTSDNSTEARESMTSTSFGANINNNNNNNNNNIDNDTNQKVPLPENVTSANRSLNRPPHHQPHLQSQQYHGIFSPQIPASLQSSLASRVDQIIRTTLHDSPAYTPPTSKNSNTTTNNNSSNSGVPNSASNSNMSSPSSSSSLIFNSASAMMGMPASSAVTNILGHPPNSGCGPTATTAPPLVSNYGPASLSAMGDTSTNNGTNSNLPTKTSAHSSASHSALAAAAALQSLNQSHVQRSQQQLAHTQQQAPFLNSAPLAVAKPPSNGSGKPVPQAAHGNSSSTSIHMPKLCITTPMTVGDHSKHSTLNTLERADNPGDFASRMQPNNVNNSSVNRMPQTSALTHLPGSWQVNSGNFNGTMPRMIAAHGGNIPQFPSSSSPYTLINAHMPQGLNTSNSMIGQDGDTLSRLSALRNSDNNPSQLHEDNSFSPNFVNPIMKQSVSTSFDGMGAPPASMSSNEFRGPHHSLAEIRDQVTEEKLAIFAYNLLSAALPGTNRCKKIVHMDDEMRDSIHNGEFYSKYEHIATGILTNTTLVPNFSIIDYLRKDRFAIKEVERIERVNMKLGASNFVCLMELVRQRPFIPPTSKPPSGIEMNRPYSDSIPVNVAPNMSFQHDTAPGVSQSAFIRNSYQLMSSSPTRSDLGPLSIDKSRRSSQSPSEMSRSQQFGSNINSLKFLNAQNQLLPNQQNPSHSSPVGCNQFGTSPYSVNQQRNHQQHTPSQANRSSPFQQPMSVCPQVMARPPRSHSTIGGLNIGQFNTPSNLAPVRQPPAAHQSSNRPHLVALASEILPSPAHSTTIPVTAHMSSRTPQTPRLPENLVPIKSSLSSVGPFTNKTTGRQPAHLSQPDFQSSSARQEFDTIHGMPNQTLLSLRQQETSNRDLATKRSIPTHYSSPNVPNIGPMSGITNIDMSRHGLIDNHYGLMQSHNSPQISSQNNNPLGLANIGGHPHPNFPSNSLGPQSNPTMPPPSGSSSNDFQRHTPTGVVNRGTMGPNATGSSVSENDSQLSQYNSLMATYQQQQIMLSNKLIDNGPGALPPSNMTSRTPISNQSPTLQRLGVSEPMSIDIAQARQTQSQVSSPKSANQRSIITGSASGGSKKIKKAKMSPVANNQTQDKISPTGSIDNAPMIVEKSFADQITTFQAENELREEGGIHAAAAEELQSEGTIDAQASGCNDRASHQESISAHGESAALSSLENSESINSSNLSTDGTLPNLSDQTITIDEKSIEESSLLEPEAKSSICSNDTSLQNISLSQPSKYQKIFTKKAWLKNYDEEDQARLNEAATNNVTDKMKDNVDIVKTGSVPQSPLRDTADRSPTPAIKPNGSLKNGKTSRSESKKKAKEVKTKKANSISAIKSSRPSNKTTDNDSEGTTASTSELDDTDETDSIKSSGDKKLRRMPRRKVKSNPDRESTDAPSKDIKPKVSKDAKDKGATRKRGKKDTQAAETSNIKRKYNSDDETVKQKTKKVKEEDVDKSADSTSPKNKKRVGEKFLQTQPCYEIVPKAIRCLECRRVRQSSFKGDKTMQSKQASRANWDDFCRFFEFRKLRYNKAAQIVVAGFSDSTDAKDTDKQLWLPTGDITPTNITYKVAKFILENIGDEFCNLVLQERSVIRTYEARSGDKRTTWKRAVNGLRELCDVCTTTLFNCHYVCERCGFVVCIDCHQSRADNQVARLVEEEVKKEPGDSGDSNHDVTDPPVTTNKKSKKDSHGWIFCAKNEEHSHDKLALAKIIAGDCLEEVWTSLHKMQQRLCLRQCQCTDSHKSSSGWDIDQVDTSNIELEKESKNEICHSTLKGLLLATSISATEGSGNDDKDTELGVLAGSKINKNEAVDSKVFDFANDEDSQDDSEQVSAAIESCIASLNIEGQDCSEPELSDAEITNPLTKTHLKLCDGDLLVLTHSRHKENTQLFRGHWKQGKPVLVRDIHKRMNIDMWLPQFFSGKFGDYRSDLVDCRNGDIHRQSMRKYWDGFEPNPAKRRAKDDNVPGHIPSANNEEPSAISTSYYSGSALWRLKDWPPGQDFKEILPEHYEDFMNNLPLSSYTTRTGRLNLACRLPKEMVKPDLGPKMYSAYGTTKFPERGTTNLHLDISDAVNVMVYVGGANPFNQGSPEYAEIYDISVEDCHVDDLMKAQIREHRLIPGALWHIFRPSDVHKMREFLNKVSDECKISLEKRNDPIHDQIWYLDQNLLDRLYKEYGVKSYSILQCMGDAILIPAGAPHQVKNLQNCIKVANDFVSPENVRYCLQLTDEFRNLPETHINQEDKLQIKNILYHSVKESIQYIDLYESGIVTANDEPSDEDDC